MKQVLVIAAHPDDELLGVGGTIRRLADSGASVRALILAEGITSRSEQRDLADPAELQALVQCAERAAAVIGYQSIDLCRLPDNRMDSMDLLDVIKTITPYIERYAPDTIFTHHHGDLNIDHRITCEAVLTACRPTKGQGVKRIYAFETPSSTEWNYYTTETFAPNVYFDVTASIEAKLEAMRCYTSELPDAPHPRSLEALRALAYTRGSQSGYPYAEAFMLLRENFDAVQTHAASDTQRK